MSDTRHATAHRFALGFVALTLATACSAEISIGTGGLDVDELEATIEEELFGEGTDQSYEHTPVNCPQDPDDSPGSAFICTTSVDGEQVTVRVTVDEDGADFIREQAIIDLEVARNFLADFIENQTGTRPSRLECPDQAVWSPGESFTCTAFDADGNGLEVEVIVRDVEGNVDVEIAS